MGTIFSRVKLSGKHVAALLALMLLSAVTAMLLPTALASMIDIGVAGDCLLYTSPSPRDCS